MSRAKDAALFVVRLFGFRRLKPATRLGRYYRTSERAVLTGLLLYLGLISFPQPLFAYNVSAQGVTVYSRSPLPVETATRIDEALTLVRSSELAVPGRTERIFVCDNPWLFHLFAPLALRGFGVSYLVSDNIFIAPSDLTQNVSRSSSPVNNRRTFSGVAAHEITHGLIRHRLG
jgi:hypothetical protein